MLSYIIHTTVIWLISLLFYVLFLRRETFFQWNRLYLGFTFLLGVLLPLYPMSATLPPIQFEETHYIRQAINLKENIIREVSHQPIGFGHEAIAWFLLLCGSLISLLLISRDLWWMHKLYRQANVYPYAEWTIVETHAAHTPFSWGHYLFIRSRHAYSDLQFEIILQHEAVHRQRRHYADTLLLSLFQLIFWFHPLLYCYRYFIKLTHEFEADSQKTANTEVYGHFLISQAIGTVSPLLAHTFSSSPLKNRIMMLTQKKSTRLKALKYMAIVPVLLTSMVMISYAQQKVPQKKDLGNGTFEYNGNVFAQSSTTQFRSNEVLQVKDRKGTATTVSINPGGAFPDMLNGEKVRNAEAKECSMPELKSKYKDLSHYLYERYRSDFESLPDNEYEIHMVNFIISEKGKVVLIERLSVGGISVSDFSKLEKRKPINDDTAEKLKKLSAEMIMTLLNDTEFKPGIAEGKVVPAKYWESGHRWKIVVSNGQTRMTENNE